ncbi:MAG: hypothetical protein NC935_07525 [Candidatus Omnitrophica bacterium]|nr:hypothetical protein [Candidatus Omnitrophota bacterium]
MLLAEQELKIKRKIQEILQQNSIDLVDFKIFCSGKRYTVRCLIDYPYGGIKVDDCAKINEKIFSFIDETKILGEDFVVEVNSPGLDRPLQSYKDFLRFKNKEVKIWYKNDQHKDSYIEGEIVSVDQDFVLLKKEDNIINISLSKIKLGKVKI